VSNATLVPDCVLLESLTSGWIGQQVEAIRSWAEQASAVGPYVAPCAIVMWRIRGLAVSVGLGLPLATASAQIADQQLHEQKYCSALSAVEEDLARLDRLTPSPTHDELRAAVTRMNKDTSDVVKEARKIRAPSSWRLVHSVERLARQSRALPDSMPMEDARSGIDDDVRAVQQTTRHLASEAGCTGAAPSDPPLTSDR
jgi:hypothetical protein